MNKKVFAGVLAAVMAVSSSFMSYADSFGAAPGETVSQETTASSGVITVGQSDSQDATVTAGGSSSQDGTVTAGENSSQSSTVTAGSSAQTESSSSGTVTAGESSSQSGTVTAGNSAQTESSTSGTITAGGSQSMGPISGGSVSGVVGPGLAGGIMGPGGPGVSGGTPALPGGTDGFAGTVQNPIVMVTEKYTYDTMSQDIRELSSRYSGKMQVNTIGTTHDGRSLYEIIVGNPSAEKHVLIHAGIHGREYMTPLLVMKQLEYGLYFYDSGSFDGRSLADMFSQVAVHFVPMVNPDGISISQNGINGIRTGALQETVRQCYNNDISLGRTSMAFERYLQYWKANGRGVDLNQNFPANWEKVTSSSLPSYAAYKGPGPVSEPESQALYNLVNSRSWAATISYHSMGNIIYWDYPGNAVYNQSLDLANTISARTGYRLAGSSGHGGFKDWIQIKEGPVPSLTLEVGSVSCPMPVSEFTDVWNRNRDVWAALMKWAIEH